MSPIKILFPTLALACLPLAARMPDPEAPGHRHHPTPEPVPNPAPLPGPKDVPLPDPLDPEHPKALAAACAATGCPKEDQHGHAPVKCEFKSGLATGFRCILFCSYPDSQWGSIVDASQCK